MCIISMRISFFSFNSAIGIIGHTIVIFFVTGAITEQGQSDSVVMKWDIHILLGILLYVFNTAQFCGNIL